jgi:hypothetical protein
LGQSGLKHLGAKISSWVWQTPILVAVLQAVVRPFFFGPGNRESHSYQPGDFVVFQAPCLAILPFLIWAAKKKCCIHIWIVNIFKTWPKAQIFKSIFI